VNSSRKQAAAINTTIVLGGEGSRRWRLVEGQECKIQYGMSLLLQYEEVKGVCVGISRMAKNKAKYSQMCTDAINDAITT